MASFMKAISSLKQPGHHDATDVRTPTTIGTISKIMGLPAADRDVVHISLRSQVHALLEVTELDIAS